MQAGRALGEGHTDTREEGCAAQPSRGQGDSAHGGFAQRPLPAAMSFASNADAAGMLSAAAADHRCDCIHGGQPAAGMVCPAVLG